MEPQNSTSPRRRFQFSLSTLILLVITIGAVLGFYFSQRETNRLRGEVYKLREELGFLNIDDPKKLHARALRVNDNLKWRWRIYVPDSRPYALQVQSGQIGEAGFASGSGMSSTLTVGQGEFTIEAEVRKVYPGQVEIHILKPNGKVTCSAKSKQPGFDDWAEGSSSTSQVDEKSTAYDPAKPVALLRLRAMARTSPTTASTVPAPSPGLLIWIEPK